MLPFTTYEFFILMGIFILLLHVSKFFVPNKFYKQVLFFLNALFLVLVFPKPTHFLLLILFSYVVTFLNLSVFRFNIKLWGILLLLLPLVLVKSDIRVHYYPFRLNDIISFAGLSYASFKTVGLYMEKANNENMPNLFSYFNFLAFTPSLLIGPIDRYSNFKKSEDLGFRNLIPENFISAWNYLVKGIAFKFILAELVSRYWLNDSETDSLYSLSTLNTIYAYYFYLFFDFAGYSFMALGVGKMMGIHLPLNFNKPYLAQNPQDFWNRFHISLGTWLKDNFFSPLYLFFTRKKKLKKMPLFRQNVSLFLTFTLMGCWNGFSLNFILSGVLFAIYSAVYNTYIYYCKKYNRDIVFGNMNSSIVKYLSIFIMFHLAAFSLYIFSGYCTLF
ncbi:MAG: D-alanyl transfer protein [Flavobacteriales bacterium]|nr:D-alanyl transfer protein [Flavobacteriales bacterium]